MKVLKFGGTSVGTAHSLDQVRRIVMSHDEPIIVVVSALGGMTDQLVELADSAISGTDASHHFETFARRFENLAADLLTEPMRTHVKSMIGEWLEALRIDLMDAPHDKHFHDVILSYGERMSSMFISHLFESKETVVVPSLKLISTVSDNRSLDAATTFANIADYFAHCKADIYVVPGFIATSPDGHITNLGRGGSDLTAAIIARALHSKKIEIWTDVDGYMTADPRKNPDARPITTLSYNEALDMSLNGAKVVYAPALEIMKDVRIPLEVRNTFNPEGSFTTVY